MKTPQARIRIDFAPGSSLGPGKIALLEAIEQTGSLSAAGRAVKMSYRRAWLLLHDINAAFSEPAVSLVVGGKAGGGARITDFGRTLVAQYREFEAAVQTLVGRSFPGVRPAAGEPQAVAGRRQLQRAAPGRKAKG